jgi:hypothetical protein
MSEAAAVLRVGGNVPRLLKDGEPAPPPASAELEPPDEAPHAYWTPDKAQHVVAQICRAGSKFYGPSIKAAEWELELIGDPAAAVLNDWLPLRVGASSDKTANLIALGAVLAILVLLRLPDILEVHGVIKPWKPKGQQPAVPDQVAQPAAAAPVNGTFEPQLVGANGGGGGGDDRRRDEIFGAQQVGGSGGFVQSS